MISAEAIIDTLIRDISDKACCETEIKDMIIAKGRACVCEGGWVDEWVGGCVQGKKGKEKV